MPSDALRMPSKPIRNNVQPKQFSKNFETKEAPLEFGQKLTFDRRDFWEILKGTKKSCCGDLTGSDDCSGYSDENSFSPIKVRALPTLTVQVLKNGPNFQCFLDVLFVEVVRASILYT